MPFLDRLGTPQLSVASEDQILAMLSMLLPRCFSYTESDSSSNLNAYCLPKYSLTANDAMYLLQRSSIQQKKAVPDAEMLSRPSSWTQSNAIYASLL